jgi:predicted phosphodiesterase
MTIDFDLISDLHLKDRDFDWQGQATSRFCLILGDIAQDRSILTDTLRKISQCYMMVMYVDGNLELKANLIDLDRGYQELYRDLSGIPNLNYLYNNILVLNEVAFIGTNGWWNFEFGNRYSVQQAESWYQSVVGYPCDVDQISLTALNDVAYLAKSIETLTANDEIEQIVVATHTVPRLDLISHDISLQNDIKLNVMGNQLLDCIRQLDYKNKIHTWCFGHYHGTVDQIKDQIRYVNNCRGPLSQAPYYPKRITID